MARPTARRSGGRLYLKDHPEECGAAYLQQQLGGICGTAKTGSLPVDRQFLATVRAQEFSRGYSVFVDGWLLARSEARLMALMALT